MDKNSTKDHERYLQQPFWQYLQRPHCLCNAAPGPKVPLRLEVKNVTSIRLFEKKRGVFLGAVGVDFLGVEHGTRWYKY